MQQFDLLMLNCCVCGAIFQLILEICFWPFMVRAGKVGVSTPIFLLKYVAVPTLLNFFGMGLAFIIFHKRYKYQNRVTYAPITAMLTMCFSIYFVHSAFGNLFIMLFFLPMIISTLYGEKKIIKIVCAESTGLKILAYYLSAVFSPIDFATFRGTDPLRLLENTLFIISMAIVCLMCLKLVDVEKEKETLLMLNISASITDMLTGLKNRKGLREAFDRIVAMKDTKAVYSLIFMDIDRFKELNDTLGHQAGDEYLKCLGEILSSIEGVETFRYGGDEFCLIVPKHADDCVELCHRIQDEYRKMPICQGNCESSLSFGIESWDGILTPSEWLHHADAALYEAKNTRGSVVKYSDLALQ